MILGGLLLIISVCTAQTSVGKLNQCKNTDSCQWREGKVVYDVSKAKQTGRNLYYTESYTIRAGGRISFKISENRRKYFFWNEYSNVTPVNMIFGKFPAGTTYDRNAPTVVNGKVQVNNFRSIHDSPYTHTKIKDQSRTLDAEYVCEGLGKYDEIKCNVEIYLMKFSVPYEAQAMNKNKTCKCTQDGIYSIKNYPDVVLTNESRRVEL